MNVGQQCGWLDAQAKVNLFLRVGQREKDGYHPLRTLFHRLDLADVVSVVVGGSGRSIDCAGPAMPTEGLGPEEKNLAYRAAALYAERTGWPDGFVIELTKFIPVGGGLGGGSADAAGVLRILNHLSPAPVAERALVELGSELGADVAFLASPRVASFASGRGDELESPHIARDALPRRPVILVVPAFAISTAKAYSWLDAAGMATSFSSDPVTPGWNWDSIEKLSDAAGNDFEPVVEARYPELREYRERLKVAGARVARLSGSGSTVFGIFAADAPPALHLPGTTTQLRTWTASRVVQVEVRE